MPVDPHLLALPSLRRQAEADARESLSFALRDSPDGDLPWTLWDNVTAHNQQRAIDHHARLLADPTRWQSQAWALRRIAELLWNAETCTLEHDGETWIIRRDRLCFIRFSPTGWHAGEFHPAVSGIYADTPRAEVLAAILLHVEEA